MSRNDFGSETVSLSQGKSGEVKYVFDSQIFICLRQNLVLDWCVMEGHTESCRVRLRR